MTTISLDLSTLPELAFMGQLASEILAQADALHIPIFMAGAMARDLILTSGYGINTGRATTDVDWAMLVESWEQFEALKAALIATGRFFAQRKTHQIRYGQTLLIDLMPFGGIENEQGLITWPPGNHTVMNVLGFRDAYQNTLTARLPGTVDIQVVSLPALALLKILAWDDRHLIFPTKDAHDFALIARHYINAGNQDRLYSDFSDWLNAPDFDYELASARMLGIDMGMAFRGPARTAACNILKRETDVQGPLAFIAAMPMAAERALLLVEYVVKGLVESLLAVGENAKY
jgi:predicted nucleotidyltransferase